MKTRIFTVLFALLSLLGNASVTSAASNFDATESWQPTYYEDDGKDDNRWSHREPIVTYQRMSNRNGMTLDAILVNRQDSSMMDNQEAKDVFHDMLSELSQRYGFSDDRRDMGEWVWNASYRPTHCRLFVNDFDIDGALKNPTILFWCGERGKYTLNVSNYFQDKENVLKAFNTAYRDGMSHGRRLLRSPPSPRDDERRKHRRRDPYPR